MTRREYRRARRVVIRGARLSICGSARGVYEACCAARYRRGDAVRGCDILGLYLGALRWRHRDLMAHLRTLDPRRLP